MALRRRLTRNRRLFLCGIFLLTMYTYMRLNGLSLELRIVEDIPQDANYFTQTPVEKRLDTNHATTDYRSNLTMHQPKVSDTDKDTGSNVDVSGVRTGNRTVKQLRGNINTSSEVLLGTRPIYPTHPAPDSCPPELHYAQDLPMTMLFSFPGSGNTWVRHLLQQLTGIYTGSRYNDGSLKKKGFLGESRRDGTVVAIKTHDCYWEGEWDWEGYYPGIKRAILIIREPKGAALAELNRRRGGHTGKAKRSGKADSAQLKKLMEDSRFMNDCWLNFPGPLHVLRYERLKTDLRDELRKLLRFLDWEVTDAQLDCACRNAEGNFHRNHAGEDNPFTAEQEALSEEIHRKVRGYYARRVAKGFHLSM